MVGLHVADMSVFVHHNSNTLAEILDLPSQMNDADRIRWFSRFHWDDV